MNIADRAKNIVIAPKHEWGVVETEPTSVGWIYRRYVIPLALIPAAAGFIGTSLIGASIPGVGTIRIGLMAGLVSAVLQIVLTLVLVYVLALIIDALAPTFGGRRNELAAFKVAAYSMTPVWLAGVFGILPALSILVLLGFYGIYVLYVGLPRLMRTPPDKALGYTALVVLSAIVISIAFALVLAMILGRSFTV